MTIGRSPLWMMCTLATAAALLTGCEGSYVVMGNTASMVVTCVLLWSTLKINRPGIGPDNEDDE